MTLRVVAIQRCIIHARMTDPNPFTFGALALDEAFTDREDEVRELRSDLRNGQDALVVAPRRYGKSSLALRAAQEALAEGTLVAYCDLMRTPTKERFAAALAKTVYEDLASETGQALERVASLFRGLRVRPTVEVDPETAGLRFSFDPVRRSADIDDTIERLLELPGSIGADRKRRVAIVFDEFQEVLRLDEHYPNLMRAVFQTQPEVGHVYLGSKRHLLERIFNDRNEPFWRSAKRIELGPIAPRKFAPFLRERFAATEKAIADDAVERLLSATGGHPYATQELAYFVWELVPNGFRAGVEDVETALLRVLQSEHAHFTLLWDDATANQRQLLIALAREPARVYSDDYRARHGLPSATHVQRALTALVRNDLVAKNEDGVYAITEPFLAEWIRKEQDEA
jgi:hypothetical protein